ncbi:glutamyl-tRNA synthetase [Bifidobacterium commune]|uniref:Glutamyl-tRNA synthetase n=2 Tax=Bifidobacterium commune TaxID=1505727 RepID=A0A1C4H537_9BIFI|nr:glutamyl-tRNA synthetase [Bifidobacterium commune]
MSDEQVGVEAGEAASAEAANVAGCRAELSPRIGRFAPTPSGRLHVGNVYAMLATWLSVHASDRDLANRIDRREALNCDIDKKGENGRQDKSCHSDSSSGAARSRGKVLLRIEDVDASRAVKDADKWIMDDLHWLGLDWDGEPVYQSQRADIYDDALRLLKSNSLSDVEFAGQSRKGGTSDGKAFNDKACAGETPRRSDGDALPADFPLVYPCFCSRSDIHAAAAPQEGDGFLLYPGTCRKLLAGHPDEVRSRLDAGRRHSLRLAVPQECPGERTVVFDDLVFGEQRFDLPSQVGDMVIRRSDGIFSYQLAVVVDDWLTGVNDIVRGRDLLRSTAMQIWIRHVLAASGFETRYGLVPKTIGAANGLMACGVSCADAVGVPVLDSASLPPAMQGTQLYPTYAHLPLLDDSEGVRLAKRKGSLDIGTLRDAGASPEQVVGYCAWLLGIRPPGGVHMSNTIGPVPMSAQEALQFFVWDGVRADRSDRILPLGWSDDLTRMKTNV